MTEGEIFRIEQLLINLEHYGKHKTGCSWHTPVEGIRVCDCYFTNEIVEGRRWLATLKNRG